MVVEGGGGSSSVELGEDQPSVPEPEEKTNLGVVLEGAKKRVVAAAVVMTGAGIGAARGLVQIV